MGSIAVSILHAASGKSDADSMLCKKHWIIMQNTGYHPSTGWYPVQDTRGSL